MDLNGQSDGSESENDHMGTESVILSLDGLKGYWQTSPQPPSPLSMNGQDLHPQIVRSRPSILTIFIFLNHSMMVDAVNVIYLPHPF